MNNGDEPDRPSTSKGMSDQKTTACPKETSRLNNNVVNGFSDSQCCANCDTASRRDHMIAASLVYCDQEDTDSDDDCCIYTYRGDRQEPAIDNLPVDNRSTSPLMDYLEMDFDPEPTVGNESEEEDVLVPNPANHPKEPLINNDEPMPSCSGVNIKQQEIQTSPKNNKINAIDELKELFTILPAPCENSSVISRSKEERANGCTRRNAETTEVCQNMKKMRVDDLSWTKEMIWSEKEAAQFQVDQIGTSACGATAVINTLLALRIPFNTDRIVKTINTRLRDETAPLVPYLESRTMAGCMPQDLVRTLEIATDSLVSARFFATHENMDVPLILWLASWIKKGAVPILTLNCQRVYTSKKYYADSWHHQMMYGVSYNTLRPNECAQIHLTNPLSLSSLETIQPQLFSPSVLKIKRVDVLSRWTPQTDLMSLATHPDLRWHKLNVLGQVVNLIREDLEGIKFTKHIMIPAGYKSGITLALRSSSDYSHELKSVPEL